MKSSPLGINPRLTSIRFSRRLSISFHIICSLLFSFLPLEDSSASEDSKQNLNQTGKVILIDQVPFRITEAGKYQLKQNLNYSQSSGVAINIQANDVTLNLNGFTLQGTGGEASSAIGILAVDRKRITIIHGQISGFYFGIDIRATKRDMTKSGEHTISEILADHNWYFGIRLVGSDSTIKNNTITHTGGCSKERHTIPHSVRMVGPRNTLRNNCIRDMYLKLFPGGKGEIVGVHFDQAKNSIFENNLISEKINDKDSSIPADDLRERRFGVWINGGPNKDTFLTVKNNIFVHYQVPIIFSPGSDGRASGNRFYKADVKPIRGKPTGKIMNNSFLTASEKITIPQNCGITWKNPAEEK